VLHAQQEQRPTVDDRGTGIEDRVDHLGEVVPTQDRVAFEALEQLTWVGAVAHWHPPPSWLSRALIVPITRV
jgi:hypothetical protein